VTNSCFTVRAIAAVHKLIDIVIIAACTVIRRQKADDLLTLKKNEYTRYKEVAAHFE
jgi:hypothetical protein